MKKIITLSLLVIVAACASKKEKTFDDLNKIALNSECPTDGKCSLKLIENKSIELKTDEFGKLFYALKNDQTKTIAIYTYDRNVHENVQDGNYREEVLIEIDKKSGKPITSKTIFGRFCYCKGFTGYYKIQEEVITKFKNEKMMYELQFKIKQVPQIINAIKFSLD